MEKKIKSTVKSSGVKVPAVQWDMPIAFDAAGKFVTLRQATRPGGPKPASLASLAPEKRAELTVKRIQARPDFKLGMIAGGIVDKKRAIEEVKAQSEIGRVLMEIEQRVVQNLLETVVAQAEQSAAVARKRPTRRKLSPPHRIGLGARASVKKAAKRAGSR